MIARAKVRSDLVPRDKYNCTRFPNYSGRNLQRDAQSLDEERTIKTKKSVSPIRGGGGAVGEIRVHSGKRNYSNFVSTTWLTFNDNCPVKMAVFVAAVRLEAIFVRISRSFSTQRAPRN